MPLNGGAVHSHRRVGQYDRIRHEYRRDRIQELLGDLDPAVQMQGRGEGGVGQDLSWMGSNTERLTQCQGR